MAASHLAMGYNVMYVSCEMSEFRLAERIDMNLLDLSDEDIKGLSKEDFKARLDRAKKRMKGQGKLYFKEYPTSSVGVAHVRALLNEAKRSGFVPDVLYVDYLNIMKSTRIKDRSNTYAYVKDIAEELRGLSVEFNIPIVTATQVNRDGYDNSDIDMSNTSESMGLVHTLDLFLALIQTEDLASQNQILVKQLKNRYRDENQDRKFVVGMDKSRMRMYDVESSAQKGLSQDPKAAPRSSGPKRDFSTFS
jgi:replicative DNA helicase